MTESTPESGSSGVPSQRMGISLRLRLTLVVVAVFGAIQVGVVVWLLPGAGSANWCLLSSTPVGLLATAVAGWLIAGRVVRPIQRLSDYAHTLGPETLQQPIDVGSNAVELARLQEELNQARRRLDAGLQAQERFVANVSHEIKTPIATVLAESEVLRRDPSLSADVRRFLNSTEDEMRHLGRLVESFLMLTRVRHGQTVATSDELYPVNELVMESVRHCMPMARQYGVRIVPQLTYGDGRDLLLRGDLELLRTMIDNLIRNAIRFSKRDDGVDLRVELAGDCICVHVRDFGPGLPPELIAHVFDRFAQAKGEERLGRGSGLGLEIAQGIAELHSGTIEVVNCTDTGCCFSIRLPLHPPKSD